VDVAFPRERAVHRHHSPEAAGHRNLGIYESKIQIYDPGG
jgi:hypothetical protein